MEKLIINIYKPIIIIHNKHHYCNNLTKLLKPWINQLLKKELLTSEQKFVYSVIH